MERTLSQDHYRDSSQTSTDTSLEIARSAKGKQHPKHTTGILLLTEAFLSRRVNDRSSPVSRPANSDCLSGRSPGTIHPESCPNIPATGTRSLRRTPYYTMSIRVNGKTLPSRKHTSRSIANARAGARQQRPKNSTWMAASSGRSSGTRAGRKKPANASMSSGQLCEEARSTRASHIAIRSRTATATLTKTTIRLL